jgi:osmotically-inducible protein OsmY
METALAEWNAMTADTVSLLDSSHPTPAPHQMETAVRRRLLETDALHFSSLVVRRVRDGVCLEGVVEMGAESPDVVGLVMAIEGVGEVHNRLVVRHPLPRKK